MHFIQGVSVNPQKNLMRQVLLLFLFCMKGKRLTERKEVVQVHITSKY